MQKNIQRLVLAGSLGLAVSMGGLAGCSSTPHRSAGEHRDDVRTAKRVNSALKDSMVYKFDDVDVKTYNGVVQLSGWTMSPEQKRKAEDIARNVPGVRDVVNGISLKTHAGAPQAKAPSSTAQGSAGADVQVEKNGQSNMTEQQRQQQQEEQRQYQEEQRQYQQDVKRQEQLQQQELQRKQQLRWEQITP